MGKGFRLKEFRRAKFEARTAEIKFPELSEWFEEGCEPVFVVRGLTGREISELNNLENSQDVARSFVEAAAAGLSKEAAESALKLLGGDNHDPLDLRMQIFVAKTAVVDPEGMGDDEFLKISKAFPMVLKRVFKKVLELTELGQMPVKKKGDSAPPTPEPEQSSSTETAG